MESLIYFRYRASISGKCCGKCSLIHRLWILSEGTAFLFVVLHWSQVPLGVDITLNASKSQREGEGGRGREKVRGTVTSLFRWQKKIEASAKDNIVVGEETVKNRILWVYKRLPALHKTRNLRERFAVSMISFLTWISSKAAALFWHFYKYLLRSAESSG